MSTFKRFGEQHKRENPYDGIVLLVGVDLKNKDYFDITYKHAEALGKHDLYSNDRNPDETETADVLREKVIQTYEELGIYSRQNNRWHQITAQRHDDIAAWLIIFNKISLPPLVNINTYTGLTAAVNYIDPTLRKRPPWLR